MIDRGVVSKSQVESKTLLRIDKRILNLSQMGTKE